MAFLEGKATNQRGSLEHNYRLENLSKLLDFDIQESHGQVVNGIILHKLQCRGGVRRTVERWCSGLGRKVKDYHGLPRILRK